MTIVVNRATGATAKPVGILYVPPELQVIDAGSATSLGTTGLDAAFTADLLSAFLAHERCGTHLYRSVATRTAMSNLRQQYEHFGAETERHVRLLEDLVEAAGGDPHYISPAARATELAGTGLLESTYRLRGSVDDLTAEVTMLEAVLLAEAKDRGNWELLSQLATRLGSGALRKQAEAACAEVLPQEEEHYGWAWQARATMLFGLATGGDKPAPGSRGSVQRPAASSSSSRAARPRSQAGTRTTPARRAASTTRAASTSRAGSTRTDGRSRASGTRSASTTRAASGRSGSTTRATGTRSGSTTRASSSRSSGTIRASGSRSSGTTRASSSRSSGTTRASSSRSSGTTRASGSRSGGTTRARASSGTRAGGTTRAASSRAGRTTRATGTRAGATSRASSSRSGSTTRAASSRSGSATRTTRATGTRATGAGRKPTTRRPPRGARELDGLTREELYRMAQELSIEGRSQMTRDELRDAVARAGGRR